jgi:hypothetical protein
MARFFLHLHECGNVVRDAEGLELPDLRSAIVQALRGARSIIAADVENGAICLSCHIEIENAETTERTIVSFREAVEVRGL